MGRPRLTEDEKRLRLATRLASNVHEVDGGCWEHVGPEFYKISSSRYKPRTCAWLVSGEALPEPRHIYYVSQLDSCTVEVCVNPKHLTVKANEIDLEKVRNKEQAKAEREAAIQAKREKRVEDFVAAQGGVLRGDPPDGAIWGDGLDVIWIDFDKWEQTARARGKDDDWVEATRPRIIQRTEDYKAAHPGVFSDLIRGAGV